MGDDGIVDMANGLTIGIREFKYRFRADETITFIYRIYFPSSKLKGYRGLGCSSLMNDTLICLNTMMELERIAAIGERRISGSNQFRKSLTGVTSSKDTGKNITQLTCLVSGNHISVTTAGDVNHGIVKPLVFASTAIL